MLILKTIIVVVKHHILDDFPNCSKIKLLKLENKQK